MYDIGALAIRMWIFGAGMVISYRICKEINSFPDNSYMMLPIQPPKLYEAIPANLLHV